MRETIVFDAIRTPRGRGRPDGSLHPLRPADLLVSALQALQRRFDLDTREVEDLLLGCVTQTGEQGGCIARFALLEAGWADTVPGVTLNRFCGSALEAVNLGSALVNSGQADLVVAGGLEHMSRAPMGSDGGAWFDAATQWRVGSVPQGISADLLATREGVSRQDLDVFAVESQRKASEAREGGVFSRSVVPVLDENGLPWLEVDELPRPGTTVESLSRLKPSFETMGRTFGLDTLVRRRYPEIERIQHLHTAGNSSGIVDGASLVLLGTREKGEALGLKPRARIVSTAVVGTEPLIMLLGPMPATRKALARAGMGIHDIDLFEVNEAFAVVPLLWMREFGVSPDRVNVHGGAIALGHPLGATGAMLLGTALDALEERNLSTALVTLCIGGGMGIATILERVG
jgi:acetyl-CoA C-acetyltransferase